MVNIFDDFGLGKVENIIIVFYVLWLVGEMFFMEGCFVEFVLLNYGVYGFVKD